MNDGLLRLLVTFGRALRSEGIAVGPGDVAVFCSALVRAAVLRGA